MKESIKAVMLPTEDKNPVTVPFLVTLKGLIHKHVAGGEFRRRIKEGCVPYHVYITVSQDVEPIREGDWFYHINLKKIFKCCKASATTIWANNMEIGDVVYRCSKIIATDDLNLTSYLHGHNLMTTPQLQQSFIKEFVDNLDGEYEVDYETKCYCGHTTTCDCGEIEEKPFIQILKVNQDSTVNITSVEE